jgi:uncharacterized protein (DUF305 family)
MKRVRAIVKFPIFILTLPIFLLASLTACANSSTFTSADRNFAAMMIPHHEQALEMSELALRNSQSEVILNLARQIGDSQDPEIALMKSWGSAATHMHGSGEMGMLTKAELAELRLARGEEFDQLFLVGMIKHHRGAIEMAQEVLDSQNPAVSELAREIIETQKSEIAEMKLLLRSTD